MQVIPSVTISGSKLVSSTLAEPSDAEQEWNNVEAFGAGAQVVNTTTHRTYMSLQSANINHALPSYPSQMQNDWWIDIGPTNKWRMFDLVADTQSVGSDGEDLTVVIAPGERVNTLLMDNIVGDSVTISATSGASTVYGPETFQFVTRNVASWYDYFYAPFKASNAIGVFDLPPRTDIQITVTIARAAGAPAVGDILVGTAYSIGKAQFPLKKNIQNFSKITTDDFGNTSFVRRTSKAILQQDVVADAALWSQMEDLRKQLNGVPCGWSTLDSNNDPLFPQFIVIGWYSNWEAQRAKATIIEQTLEVRQL